MYGATDAGLILDYTRSIGAFVQLDLDLEPRKYYLNPDFACDVEVSFKYDDNSKQGLGQLSYIDHPSFTALRKHLAASGHIVMETRWHNGDRVIKNFYLNGKLFSPQDQFFCAAALKHCFKQ